VCRTKTRSGLRTGGHYLRDIPAWPQLPKRTFLENMYAQYSEGFPGIVIKGEKI